MDPDEAFRWMLQYFQERQWVEAIEQAESLLAWLRADGFAPQVAVSMPDGSLPMTHRAEWFNRAVAEATARMVLQSASHHCQPDSQ